MDFLHEPYLVGGCFLALDLIGSLSCLGIGLHLGLISSFKADDGELGTPVLSLMMGV